ncbi:hypothetical protein AMECASPLE_027674, partial [Ameca splendens]
MSSPASMHTQLAAVIEGLVDAAVAELQRLEEERPVVGAREERHEAFRVQTENREKLVRFASIMETLGNEALGKILNIMDEARLVVQVGRGSKKHQTNILNHTALEQEHSYGVRKQSSETEKMVQVKTGGCAVETPFVPAVSVRDGHGNIDPGAIRE